MFLNADVTARFPSCLPKRGLPHFLFCLNTPYFLSTSKKVSKAPENKNKKQALRSDHCHDAFSQGRASFAPIAMQ